MMYAYMRLPTTGECVQVSSDPIGIAPALAALRGAGWEDTGLGEFQTYLASRESAPEPSGSPSFEPEPVKDEPEYVPEKT